MKEKTKSKYRALNEAEVAKALQREERSSHESSTEEELRQKGKWGGRNKMDGNRWWVRLLLLIKLCSNVSVIYI